MKCTKFRQATITPLRIFSIWIGEWETEEPCIANYWEPKEYIHSYYITDDFGNAVCIKPLSIYGYERQGIRIIGTH